ncbi:hypothetical protein VTK26DRAFT_9238 [Humicola hyalothermophila]
MSKPDTEILVHIAAPARAADDTKYRALAAAYLDFEPASRTSIGVVGLDAPESTRQGVYDEAVGSTEDILPRDDAPPSTPDLPVIETPILSFRSAINNLGTPQLQGFKRGDPEESRLSWRAPPSVVQDSMPENHLAFAQFCTPTRILEHYTSGFDSSQPDSSPANRREPGSPFIRRPDGDIAEEVAEPRQSQDGVNAGGRRSPLLGTKRPPPPTPTPSASTDETHISSSNPSQPDQPAALSRADSEPPLSKRPKTFAGAEPGKPLTRSASDVGPQRHPGPSSASAHARALSSQLPAPEALEIVSPPPPTSDAPLREADLVTPLLASLARELDLARRFAPTSQSRALRPFERGYWLVDCAGWEAELKRSAWAFLADYLGQGAAGWGASCRRDAGFTRIRLYCWGCVVGHMYLVVYLASRRRVLHTGTKWVGADGEAVVVMAPTRGGDGGGAE